MSDRPTETEADVDRYLQEGNTEAAVKALYALVIEHVRGGAFSKAEALRDRLYAVDAMALTEIIKAGEAIEEAKRAGMSRDLLVAWKDLYRTLSSEEANALYYAQKSETFEPGQRIFRQGETHSRMYFIEEGQGSLSFRRENRDILLCTIVPGDVVNADAFFSNTICTFSFSAVSALKAHALDQDVLTAWEKSFPALEGKLLGYCSTKRKKAESPETANRRQAARRKHSTAVYFRLMNASGEAFGNTFNGSLIDISTHGLSYSLKIAARSNARMLLGRALELKVPLPATDAVVSGTVVAVHHLPFDDYSVHVRFHKVIREDSIKLPASAQ